MTAGPPIVARARVCVLACGASYALQRRLGLGMPRLLLHSAQVELPAERLGDVEVHFGRSIAPRGLCVGGPGAARTALRAHRRDVRPRRQPPFPRHRRQARSPAGGSCASDLRQPRQKILPLGPIERTYGDRVLALGDAAGLVKPTTGGGIYYSLLSAHLAAETLAEMLPQNELSAASLSVYERRWRKRLGSELRWQLLLRRIAHRLNDEDIDALFELARTDGIMPLVRRTAAFNHHREFITALFKHPPARRLLLRAVVA